MVTENIDMNPDLQYSMLMLWRFYRYGEYESYRQAMEHKMCAMQFFGALMMKKMSNNGKMI